MQKRGYLLSPQKRGAGGRREELLGGLVLPTVPGNPSPGLKGKGGTGLSGHDLKLAGRLPRAGITPALLAGQDLACGPCHWLLQGDLSGDGDVAQEPCARRGVPGQWGTNSAGRWAPGAQEVLLPWARLHPYPERLQHMLLPPGCHSWLWVLQQTQGSRC